MWTEVDPALSRAEIKNIFQTTFAEFKIATPLSAQPWMCVEDKSSAIAIEKARITNGGKIPASWKAAAEQSEHGQKWLKIGKEQEQAEALTRAREHAAKAALDVDVAHTKVIDAARLYNEVSRRAQQALEDSKSATSDAKRAAELATVAKEAADKASQAADEAQVSFTNLTGIRDHARLVASSAAAEVKTLEEAEVAAKSVPQSKKRKLRPRKAEDV